MSVYKRNLSPTIKKNLTGLGHHRQTVHMVHVVDSHFGDHDATAQTEHGGQEVLILTQETANDRPDQHRSETEQDSAGSTENHSGGQLAGQFERPSS